MKLSDSDIFVFDQRPEPENFQIAKPERFSHANHSKCSFLNFQQISLIFFAGGFFGPDFSKFRVSSGSNVRVTCKSFSRIRWVARRGVAAIFGMEVSMPVPGWHHLVQIFGVKSAHQPYLMVAMPMFPNFNFLVWRQMFLQALLLPALSQRLADAKRHGKGMQAKRVERANESQY